ncbi:hypothetical protein ACXR2T_07630 [Leucobacter sp. HY1910]
MTYQTHDVEYALSGEVELPRFVFVTDGEDRQAICSDTLTGLCEAFIEGYDTLPEMTEDFDPHLAARLDVLSGFADTLQAGILAAIEGEQPDFLAALSEDQVTALMHPKDAEILKFEAWESEIPLVLMAHQYMPYSDVPAPEGDAIVWLNAHDERRFLASLELMGLGQLLMRAEEAEEVVDELAPF